MDGLGTSLFTGRSSSRETSMRKSVNPFSPDGKCLASSSGAEFFLATKVKSISNTTLRMLINLFMRELVTSCGSARN